jgi:hypothetical protein
MRAFIQLHVNSWGLQYRQNEYAREEQSSLFTSTFACFGVGNSKLIPQDWSDDEEPLPTSVTTEFDISTKVIEDRLGIGEFRVSSSGRGNCKLFTAGENWLALMEVLKLTQGFKIELDVDEIQQTGPSAHRIFRVGGLSIASVIQGSDDE